MTRAPSILLVDDDVEALELARARLGAAGYSTRAAASARDGLGLARAEVPDLVVTDVAMPGMDGFAFARALRSDAALALVPIVFLTALEEPEDVLRGFHLGADDYLPKSGAFSRLPEAVGRVLERRASLASFVDERVRGGAAFEGRLEHLGLSSILFLLESTGKTGTLRVDSDAATAALYVRDGAVIGAELEGRDALRDEYVVYFASSWSKGSFAFVDGPVAGDDAIGRTTTELILEAARRQDEEAGDRIL